MAAIIISLIAEQTLWVLNLHSPSDQVISCQCLILILLGHSSFRILHHFLLPLPPTPPVSGALSCVSPFSIQNTLHVEVVSVRLLRENEGSSCRSGLGEKERLKHLYLSVASWVNTMALVRSQRDGSRVQPAVGFALGRIYPFGWRWALAKQKQVHNLKFEF
jgi:hypothetical protein